MKLYLKKTLLLLLLTIAIYIPTVVLVKLLPIGFLQVNIPAKINGYGHLNSRIKEANNINTSLDVLVLGSSHAYRGFDPRIYNEFGLNMFNLGSSAQTPLQMEVLVKKYLHKLNPKKVVIEVFPNTLISDGVESAIDLMSNSEPSIHWLNMLWQIPNFKVLNCFIYNTANYYLGMKKYPKEDIIKKDDKYISGGYVEKELRHYKVSKSRREKSLSFKPQQWSALKKIVNLVKGKGIEVELVFAPVTNALYQSYQNMAEVDSLYRSLNVKYSNYNGMLNLKDSLHFYDAHHLNQEGVKIFNHFILTNKNF